MALGFMRRHKRWLFGFLWLVIAAFIILYIPAFQGSGEGTPGEELGRVGRLPITVGELQKTHLRLRQTYDRMYQGRMNPAILKSLRLEEQAFQSLVNDRVLLLEAQRIGLTVSDQALALALQTAPEFQSRGRFLGAAEIRRQLELQGTSVAEFEQSLRGQILRQRLEGLVTDGLGATDAEVEREYRRRNEKIRAEYVFVPAQRFDPETSADETEARAHFEAHQDSYRIPERRVVSYVLVDPEALRAEVSLSDREISAYYGSNREEFLEEEQICASHILIKIAGEESEGYPEDEAERMADGLLARARAGEDFAALARASSGDAGSAQGGGDLGCFPRGRMVPEFENEAFSMQVGQVSDLVRSRYGYHIIRLNSRKDERLTPLEEVKENLRQTLLAARVEEKANEKVGLITAALGRGRSLAQVAAELKLAVQKSPPLVRGQAVEPLASPVLVGRAFALKAGEVAQEAFSIPRGFAFIEVFEIQPSRIPGFEEVKEKARTDVRHGKTMALARNLAAAIRDRAERDGLEKAAAAAGLDRKQTPVLVGRGQPLGELGASASLEAEAFSLAQGPTISRPIPLENGVAILRVLEKQPFDLAEFERQKAGISAALREEKRSRFFQAYMLRARDRFPIERRPDAFRRMVG